jgi:hypothetical protein
MSAKDESTVVVLNKKLKAYAFISIASLINFASVAEAVNVEMTSLQEYFGNHGFNIMWGVISFVFSLLIMIADVVSIVRNKFDFKTVMDGKLEGYALFGLILIWAFGLGFLTHAGAIGYSALNVYFSAWVTFFACIWTFNLWLSEKDYVTIQQMCKLSATLPYWWILCFASIVTFSSAADARLHVAGRDTTAENSCDFAIGVGVVSFFFSLFFVLSHYEFLRCSVCTTWMTYGGVFELVCAVIVDIWQIIAVHTLTSAGKIASTITGTGDFNSDDYVP